MLEPQREAFWREWGSKVATPLIAQGIINYDDDFDPIDLEVYDWVHINDYWKFNMPMVTMACRCRQYPLTTWDLKKGLDPVEYQRVDMILKKFCIPTPRRLKTYSLYIGKCPGCPTIYWGYKSIDEDWFDSHS